MASGIAWIIAAALAAQGSTENPPSKDPPTSRSPAPASSAWDPPPWLVPTVVITEDGDFLRVEFLEGATTWDLVDVAEPYLRIRWPWGSAEVLATPLDVICDPGVVDRPLGVRGTRLVPRDGLWDFFVSTIEASGSHAHVIATLGTGQPAYVELRASDSPRLLTRCFSRRRRSR